MKWPRAATTAGAVIETKPEKAPMPKELPPIETLRQLLDYDPASGILTWKPRPRDMFANNDLRICNTWNTRYAGKEALGSVDSGHGYKVGAINGASYLAHRVAWTMQTGLSPKGEIDHINGNRSDNRFANLRDVTKSENQRNAVRRSDNTSGVTGVFWHKASGKWQATAGNDRVGLFADKEAAIAARRKAIRERGYHANHGKEKGDRSRPIP
jgi:hypothetical protein